jgi:hypothetical protein
MMKKHCDIEECNGINRGIDLCIQQMVRALNDGGIETIASCCGHGNTIGSIALKDGRELMIAPDFETAREVERYWPDIHGEWKAYQSETGRAQGERWFRLLRHTQEFWRRWT